MKRCTRCKQEKPPDCFNRDRTRGDGLQARCRDCERDWNRAWRLANADQKRATSHAHYEANRDEILERHRRRYAENPEKKLRSNRAWQRANTARVTDGAARYRARLRQAPRVEKIDREYIYGRDRGICHICRRRVAARGFTLDHLVPLSRGGSHSHDNLAVAHLRCNSRRRDGRIPAQLLLVG